MPELAEESTALTLTVSVNSCASPSDSTRGVDVVVTNPFLNGLPGVTTLVNVWEGDPRADGGAL